MRKYSWQDSSHLTPNKFNLSGRAPNASRGAAGHLRFSGSESEPAFNQNSAQHTLPGLMSGSMRTLSTRRFSLPFFKQEIGSNGFICPISSTSRPTLKQKTLNMLTTCRLTFKLNSSIVVPRPDCNIVCSYSP
jgi:hypothetical protein